MLTVRLVICIALSFSLVAGATSARILYVPTEFGTITSAVETASDYDTIVIAAGTYQENIRVVSKKIVIASCFLFDSSAISIRETVIDGAAPLNPDYGSVVAVLGSGSSGTAIVGLTLRNGIGTFLGDKYAGGGILVADGSDARIANNLISSNNATRGGGIALYGSNSTLESNIILGNYSTYGGGLDLNDSPSIISRNAFNNNDASIAGGGIHMSNSQNVIVTDNIIYQNRAATGGGIAADASNPFVAFNDLWDNSMGNFSGCESGLGDTACCLNLNRIPCDVFSNIFRYPAITYPGDSNLLDVDCNSVLIDAGSELNPGCPLGGTRIDIGPTEHYYIVGDLNADLQVDITDAVYLIDYVFMSAWTPCPRWAGDWNGDRRVNSIDVAQLLSYIFRNGKAQACSNQN